MVWKSYEDRRKLGRMNQNSARSMAIRTSGNIRVLGVDPAAAGPTGYGVVESDGRNCRMLLYGALKVPAKRQKASAGAVLQDVHELLCRLMDEYGPDAVAVESVFTALNMRTALRLAEVRGVVLLAAAQRGIAVHSYSPREVKAVVSGYGQADKRQVQLMVRALLHLAETPEPADASDALAVALCHLQKEQVRRRLGLTEKVTSTVQNSRYSAKYDSATRGARRAS